MSSDGLSTSDGAYPADTTDEAEKMESDRLAGSGPHAAEPPATTEAEKMRSDRGHRA